MLSSYLFSPILTSLSLLKQILVKVKAKVKITTLFSNYYLLFLLFLFNCTSVESFKSDTNANLAVTKATPSAIGSITYIDKLTGNGINYKYRIKALTTSLRFADYNGKSSLYLSDSSDKKASVTFSPANSEALIQTTLNKKNLQFKINPLILANANNIAFSENERLAIYISSFPNLFGLSKTYLGSFKNALTLIKLYENITNSENATERQKERVSKILTNIKKQVVLIEKNKYFSYGNSINTVNNVAYRQLKIDSNGSSTSYASLGEWSKNEGTMSSAKNGTSTIMQHGYIAYGIETINSQMPNKGTASYSGKLIGTRYSNNKVNNLTGEFQANVNFGEHKITTGLDIDILVTQANGTSLSKDWKNFSGEGYLLHGNEFSTFISDNIDKSFNGKIEGKFYGPAANEIAGIFKAQNNNTIITGAIIAKQ